MIGVALIGAQRTGKTTTLQLLEAHNNGAQLPDCDFYFAREAATDLIREHGPDIVRDPRFQDMLFAEQSARENAARTLASRFGGTWIADRTIIDNIAFIFYLRKINPLGSDHPENDFPIRSEWLEYIKAHPFDVVYLCDPADIELQPEMNIAWTAGTIDEERRIRNEVHACYIEALAFLDIPYRLLSGTPEERITTIRDTIVELYAEADREVITTEGASSEVEVQ